MGLGSSLLGSSQDQALPGMQVGSLIELNYYCFLSSFTGGKPKITINFFLGQIRVRSDMTRGQAAVLSSGNVRLTPCE